MPREYYECKFSLWWPLVKQETRKMMKSLLIHHRSHQNLIYLSHFTHLGAALLPCYHWSLSPIFYVSFLPSHVVFLFCFSTSSYPSVVHKTPGPLRLWYVLSDKHPTSNPPWYSWNYLMNIFQGSYFEIFNHNVKKSIESISFSVSFCSCVNCVINLKNILRFLILGCILIE